MNQAQCDHEEHRGHEPGAEEQYGQPVAETMNQAQPYSEQSVIAKRVVVRLRGWDVDMDVTGTGCALVQCPVESLGPITRRHVGRSIEADGCLLGSLAKVK